MKNKIFLFLLAITLFFSTTTSLGVKAAHAAPVQNVTTNVTNTTEVKSEMTQQQAVKYGLKGDLVKLALDLIVTAIDRGGDVLAYILKWLDKDAASYVKNNKSKIIGGINKLDKWINSASTITQTTIKNQLVTYFKAAKVPDKYNLQIADAIARTVTWLLI